ncbi:quinol oxidase subunit 4 [Olivibacter sp. CPCC 100613]|uniref:quinol oxidase subunit 4 n=1 Tax=Olivibacter sp. CPCC 100613 TaxID=3079931 RepID=UPI002FF52974
MKKIYFLITLSGLFLCSSCYTTRTAGRSGKVPPGQVKKATGSKSAKPYAPGQQ